MAAIQELTETPEWTTEEETMCAKILNEVKLGKTNLIRIR